jgi:hypothetical protein
MSQQNIALAIFTMSIQRREWELLQTSCSGSYRRDWWSCKQSAVEWERPVLTITEEKELKPDFDTSFSPACFYFNTFVIELGFNYPNLLLPFHGI